MKTRKPTQMEIIEATRARRDQNCRDLSAMEKKFEAEGWTPEARKQVEARRRQISQQTQSIRTFYRPGMVLT